MLKIMADFRFPKMEWTALLYSLHLPHQNQHSHYSRAGRPEAAVQSLRNMAFNTFGNKTHALGLIKEALCFSGHEPTHSPWSA